MNWTADVNFMPDNTSRFELASATASSPIFQTGGMNFTREVMLTQK